MQKMLNKNYIKDLKFLKNMVQYHYDEKRIKVLVCFVLIHEQKSKGVEF